MGTFLGILMAIVALALIVVILLQPSKGEGLGSIGGGGQVFFARNKNLEKLLEKATAWLGGIFFLLALLLSIIGVE